MLRQLVVALGVVLAVVMPTGAQDDMPTVDMIQVDQVVQEQISGGAFFDWWQFQAGAGDVMVIDMAASGGLEPLLAILNPGGDAVAHTEGEANTTLQLEYTIPEPGQYTIVASRVGSADGTSTGAYSLRLRRANAPAVRDSLYQPVVFDCRNFEAATAATVTMSEDPRPELEHRVTVYGIDGFKPVIRITFSAQPDFEDCNIDARLTEGDTFTLPGEVERTVSADTLDSASQVILSGAENMNTLTLNIGSRDGAPGRYVAIIEGFTLERGGDDSVEVRIGPLAAAATAMTVYMVAAPNSRLDPYLEAPDTEQSCDDAGRRGCETVPTFAGAAFQLNGGTPATITGDRNDAGLILTPGTPDPIFLRLLSSGGRSHGAYALVLVGELPPRE